ncbi:hypothetical protein AB4Z17_05225 [Paenibacillus sp. TAF43_2]
MPFVHWLDEAFTGLEVSILIKSDMQAAPLEQVNRLRKGSVTKLVG